jgi:hypothetical protein
MALVVEDGTGLANADALFSQDFCDTYCTNNGLDNWANTDQDPEAIVRRVSNYLSNSISWKGIRKNGRNQSLAWPRIGVVDGEDNDVSSTEVPIEVKQAGCILCDYEAANPGALSPAVIMGEKVSREKIGPIEVDYQFAATAGTELPILPAVDDLLSGLVNADEADSEISGLTDRV